MFVIPTGVSDSERSGDLLFCQSSAIFEEGLRVWKQLTFDLALKGRRFPAAPLSPSN
jgi:hypothetical protein